MTGNYKVSVDVPCLELLFSCSRQQRLALFYFFDSLAANPFQAGDYEESGISGRVYQLKACRPFLVTFWVDHAVKEVRVLAIKKLAA